VVLSTTRYAADLDYAWWSWKLLRGSGSGVHNFLTQRIFPRQAEVVGAADVVEALKAEIVQRSPTS